MFILQLACSLRWEVEHKVSDYGQNLILLCRVSNCCLKDAGWYLWTPTKRTIFKDVKTARLSAPPKYSGYVRTYGFTLIINNLSQADMNVSYSCDYGLQLGDNIVLHKDDVFMNDRSGLSISVFVLIIAGGSVLTILLLAFVICICCRTLSYEHVETDDPFKGKTDAIRTNKFIIHNEYCTKIEVSFVSSQPQKRTDTSFVKYGYFEVCPKSTTKGMNNADIESGQNYEIILKKPFIGCNVRVKYTQYFLHYFPYPWYGRISLQHIRGNEMVFTTKGKLEYKR